MPKYQKPTYQKGRTCLLCDGRLADDAGDVWCCGLPTRDVLVLPGLGMCRMDRTRILPGGTTRRWTGVSQHGARIVWDDVAEAQGRGAA
ncbi:hypothetical protein ATK74_0829 [Propionicimonas paludicola]|uniref:Uncharacterized protein n=1 Tax=Propionicimonas paludicola TaxID=185243 RepID=A0A2A9CQD5_9ACTN|nr:hypothetical protein [Propionicimonas paludicola]PFG16295.1 hypothetical protein ATK74_0829 [Propionicimonas paludicola]